MATTILWAVIPRHVFVLIAFAVGVAFSRSCLLLYTQVGTSIYGYICETRNWN